MQRADAASACIAIFSSDAIQSITTFQVIGAATATIITPAQ
jgi:hypothetical protein